MNIFNKHDSHQRGRLLFSSESDKKGNHCNIYEHIPDITELDFYKGSQEEPTPFIKELMKYTSKEEQLLASDNFMNFLDLAERIHDRLEGEKQEQNLLDHNETEE